MKNRQLHRLLYRARHQYLTMSNAVIVLACLITIGWVWGSLEMMQRNHNLQRQIDVKRRQLELAQLEVQNLELEKRYYQTDEYREIAVRDLLGKAREGERVLILPDVDSGDSVRVGDDPSLSRDMSEPSNIEQWLDFLFGGTEERLQ